MGEQVGADICLVGYEGTVEGWCITTLGLWQLMPLFLEKRHLPLTFVKSS